MRKILFFVMLIASSCSGLKEGASNSAVESKYGKMGEYDEALFSAITELSLGNDEKAYGFFQKCIELIPEESVAYYEIARLDIKKNNIDLSISNASRAVSIEPNNEWYHLVLGEGYEKNADYKSAISSYEKVVSLKPRIREYHKRIIKVNKLANNLPGVIKQLEVMEKEFGVSEEVNMEKYEVFMRMDKDDDAKKELFKLIENFPTEIRYRGILAEHYSSKGDMENALIQYEKVKEMDPENGLLHWQLSHHYSAIGKDDLAFEELKAAFESTEINVGRKSEVISSFLKKDQSNFKIKQQITTLLGILDRVHPNEGTAKKVYGDYLLQEGNFEEALAKYRRASELDNSSQSLWMTIVKLDYTLGEGIFLTQDAIKSAELFPVQPVFYLYQGMGNITIGKFDQAKTALSVGIEYVVNNDELKGLFYHQLARVAEKKGVRQEADDNFEKAFLKAPLNSDIKNGHNLLLINREITNSSIAQKVDDLLNTDINNPDFLYAKAMLLFKKNDNKGSLALFDEIVKIQGGAKTIIIESYGDVLKADNRLNEAKEMWQKVFDKTGSLLVKMKIDGQ